MAATASLDFVKAHFCRFLPITNHVLNNPSKFDIDRFIGSKVEIFFALAGKFLIGLNSPVFGSHLTPKPEFVSEFLYKKHLLAPKHVVYAINDGVRTFSLGCASDEKKYE